MAYIRISRFLLSVFLQINLSVGPAMTSTDLLPIFWYKLHDLNFSKGSLLKKFIQTIFRFSVAGAYRNLICPLYKNSKPL